MGRVHVPVAVPALALRRAEAAAAIGVSVEVFDRHVRPNVPAVRVSGVTTFPVRGLEEWLTKNSHRLADDIGKRAAA